MTNLQMLKQNLEITNTLRDDYLTQLVTVAEGEIKRYGITAAESTDPEYPAYQNLVVMYAAYLYRRRAGDDPTMPRMLQWHLHQHLFAQKGATS